MFKSIFAAIIALTFASMLFAQGEKINWQIDYNKALAMSRETGKPVFIDFWAAWCKPCQMLEKEFWTRTDVAEALKAFVPLKVNYDAKPEIARLFVVRGLPFFAVSDAYGSLITSDAGYESFNLDNINRIADTLPKDLATLDDSYKVLESNKTNAVALLQIADYYRKNQMPVAAGRFYKSAFDSPDIKFETEKRQLIQVEIGRQFAAAKDFYQAAFAFQDYLKLFPSGTQREVVYAELILVYTKINRLKDAVALLDKLKADFPQSKLVSGLEKEVERAKTPAAKK